MCLGNAVARRSRLTRTEVERVGGAAQRVGVPVAVVVAEGDGHVVDGLDVVLAHDDGLEVLAGLDGLGHLDADDARLGQGEEGGGDGSDGEEHVGR